MRRETESRPRIEGERGFSVVQLLIVFAIMATVTTMAVIGISGSREYARLQNSAQLLGTYLEKARIDSIRRRAQDAAQMASVTAISESTYRVFLDFSGDGTLNTDDLDTNPDRRVVALESNVTFATASVGLSVSFNWRGRTADDVTLTLSNGNADTSSIGITAGGDISVNSEADATLDTEYSDSRPDTTDINL